MCRKDTGSSYGRRRTPSATSRKLRMSALWKILNTSQRCLWGVESDHAISTRYVDRNQILRHHSAFILARFLDIYYTITYSKMLSVNLKRSVIVILWTVGKFTACLPDVKVSNGCCWGWHERIDRRWSRKICSLSTSSFNQVLTYNLSNLLPPRTSCHDVIKQRLLTLINCKSNCFGSTSGSLRS